MTDTNNTDGAALLPVTQADRDAASQAYHAIAKGYMQVIGCAMEAGAADHAELVQLFARHRQSHSLPGDGRFQKYLADATAARERLATFPDTVRQRLINWQEGQSEWFSDTMLEIVAEFIAFDDASRAGEAENKAGGLWYRRWHTAQTRLNELEQQAAAPTPSPCPGDGMREALQLARDRLADMLMGDDGQAWKEAEKALPLIDAALTPSPLPATQEDAERGRVEGVRTGILWQLGVCADNYERDGKDVEARITRWHMGWIEHATFGAISTPQRQEYDGEVLLRAVCDAQDVSPYRGWNLTALNKAVDKIREYLGLPSIRELNPDIAAMQDHASANKDAIAAALAHPAQATPSALSGDAGEGRDWIALADALNEVEALQTQADADEDERRRLDDECDALTAQLTELEQALGANGPEEAIAMARTLREAFE